MFQVFIVYPRIRRNLILIDPSLCIQYTMLYKVTTIFGKLFMPQALQIGKRNLIGSEELKHESRCFSTYHVNTIRSCARIACENSTCGSISWYFSCCLWQTGYSQSQTHNWWYKAWEQHHLRTPSYGTDKLHRRKFFLVYFLGSFIGFICHSFSMSAPSEYETIMMERYMKESIIGKLRPWRDCCVAKHRTAQAQAASCKKYSVRRIWNVVIERSHNPSGTGFRYTVYVIVYRDGSGSDGYDRLNAYWVRSDSVKMALEELLKFSQYSFKLEGVDGEVVD